jgi:hypothetical protein
LRHKLYKNKIKTKNNNNNASGVCKKSDVVCFFAAKDDYDFAYNVIGTLIFFLVSHLCIFIFIVIMIVIMIIIVAQMPNAVVVFFILYNAIIYIILKSMLLAAVLVLLFSFSCFCRYSLLDKIMKMMTLITMLMIMITRRMMMQK